MPSSHDAPVPQDPPAIRSVPYMGVIYVVAEAMKLGFQNGHPDWCNLGQGQPEVGPMEGAPARISVVAMDPEDHAYGHIGGTDELRDTVAAHYNRLYRNGKSPYTRDNVTIASGGRLILSRIFATLGAVRVGYQIPDYTAYENMLDYHRHRVTPVCFATTPETGFLTSAHRLRERVREHQLRAFLLSNPCNPTGQTVRGEELEAYVRTARDEDCFLLLDEFYSHYQYSSDGVAGDGPVSAARFVEDVNKDPVLLVDGLTKCYRYPGWRLGWAVGPAYAIENINRAASAIDGGPSTLVQRAALDVLAPARADQETDALRTIFTRKRTLMVERLRGMGVKVEHPPTGTFYVWGDISGLPAPLDDAETFFRAALDRKVLTVPGRFFDVNPGKDRPAADYGRWVRFSFGPPEDNLVMGLDRLAGLVADAAATS